MKETYKKYKKYIWEIVSILVGIAIALRPAPIGLNQVAMRFAGIFVWAIINWIAETMPPFLSGLLMLSLFVLTGVAKFSVAFSSFSGATFWLILAVFILGIAVSKSGLMSRLCLRIMKLCPPSFTGQCAALLIGGFVLSPFMPSTTAKVGLAGAFSTRIGELLGFEPRSKGMNGLWCAMYTGFCLLAPVFMTASFFSYLITAQLTEDQLEYFSFSGWAIAMLPWGLLMLVLCFLAILLMYRPKTETMMDKAEIQRMLQEMGPLSRNEVISVVVLLICFAFWCLERTLRISATVTACIGIAVLVYLKVIDAKDINTKLNWNLIMYIGTILGLSSIISSIGFDTWIADIYGTVLGSFVSNPYLLIISVCIAMHLLRFVMVSSSTLITLLVVILIPFCEAAQINPWFAGIAAYVMAQAWYLRYQNGNTMAAFGAAGGDEKINYNATVPYCFVFHVLALICLLMSIPYWKILGIL